MSWYWYCTAQDLEREKRSLSSQNHELSRKVSSLEHSVREFGRQKTSLSNQNYQLSSQVSTLGFKVQELQRQNTKLSDDLVKQREDIRKAGILFMDAADTYQQAAKKQIRAKAAELEDTRKASLLLMNAADTYQDVAKKQAKAKAEELEEMRKAVLVLMSAADTYQQEAKKQIKEKVEELKILGAQKAEMDARIESLESELNVALSKNQGLEVDHVKMKIENNNLRSEVERLIMELGALAEAGEAAANAFDVEKAKIMKVEEIQAGKDLLKDENDNTQSEVLSADKNHSLCEAEV